MTAYADPYDDDYHENKSLPAAQHIPASKHTSQSSSQMGVPTNHIHSVKQSKSASHSTKQKTHAKKSKTQQKSHSHSQKSKSHSKHKKSQ